MTKVLLSKEANPKSVQTALVSGLKREVRQLNAEDYNYGNIMANASLFQTYAKLLGQKLGMNIEIKFDITHTTKNKLDLISSKGPLKLDDINSAFRQNYNLFTEFISQVSAIYEDTYDSYVKLRTFYNIESNEYEPALDRLKDDIRELTDLLKESDIIEPKDIEEALEEAADKTTREIQEETERADNIAKDVWDANKGFETSSDIQEKGKAAAEEYAKNSKLENDAKVAAEEAKSKTESAERVRAEADRRRAEANEYAAAAAKAEDEYYDAADAAFADATALDSMNDVLLEHPTLENGKIGDLPKGQTIDEHSARVTRITDNGDGTTTVSTTTSRGTVTRTYDNDANVSDVVSDLTEREQASHANEMNKFEDMEKAKENAKLADESAKNAEEEAAAQEKEAEEARIDAEKAEAEVPDVNRDPDKGESSSDGGKAKEQAEKSMEENRGKNGMPSNL